MPLAWWSIGVVVYCVFIVAVWPVIDGNEDFEDLYAQMPDALMAMFGSDGFTDFTSPEGFLNTYCRPHIFGDVSSELKAMYHFVLGEMGVLREDLDEAEKQFELSFHQAAKSAARKRMREAAHMLALVCNKNGKEAERGGRFAHGSSGLDRSTRRRRARFGLERGRAGSQSAAPRGRPARVSTARVRSPPPRVAMKASRSSGASRSIASEGSSIS